MHCLKCLFRWRLRTAGAWFCSVLRCCCCWWWWWWWWRWWWWWWWWWWWLLFVFVFVLFCSCCFLFVLFCFYGLFGFVVVAAAAAPICLLSSFLFFSTCKSPINVWINKKHSFFLFSFFFLFLFFFFLRSPAISLGFTTFGWDFCVCDRFLIQPLR